MEKKQQNHYGIETDLKVDWEALGKSIERPSRTAVCHILDGDGKIVISQGRPARVHVEVPVSNVKEELKKRSLRFIGWY